MCSMLRLRLLVSRRLYFTPSSFDLPDLPDLPVQERWVPAISIDRSEREVLRRTSRWSSRVNEQES
jgi:hypothetical protein